MNYTTPRDKTCQDCGRTFAAYSPKQKRCPECQSKHHRERRAEIMRAWQMAHSTATHEARECRHCGKAFVSTHKRHYYCCAACQLEEKQGAKHIERKCKRCGKPFVTRRASQFYCSHECMVLWNRHNDGEKARAARALDAAARKAARKIPRAKTPPKPKAPPPESWKIRVERELAIPDPDARFAAAQKWTPKERKYAQKLAMRGMVWRGPAYGI